MRPNLRLVPRKKRRIDWRNVFVWTGGILLSAAAWYFIITYGVAALVWP